MQPLWGAVPEIEQALPLPGLCTRLIDFEYLKARGEFRPALGEGIEPGPEDDVLAHAAPHFLGDEIPDEASAGDDARSE